MDQVSEAWDLEEWDLLEAEEVAGMTGVGRR